VIYTSQNSNRGYQFVMPLPVLERYCRHYACGLSMCVCPPV